MEFSDALFLTDYIHLTVGQQNDGLDPEKFSINRMELSCLLAPITAH